MKMFYFTKKDQMIYDAICNAIDKRDKEVILPKLSSQDNIMSIYKCVMGRKESVLYNPCTFTITSFFSKDVMVLNKLFIEKEIREKFEQKVNEIVLKIRNVTNGDIYLSIKAVYLYLINTIQYGSINTVLEEHSAWGAIMNRRAVCEGITYAFSILLNAMLIPCISVHGKALYIGEATLENHSWNIVKVNQKCYHIDVTWGLQTGSNVQLGEFDYFMLSDEEIKVDHYWNDYFIPQCNSFEYNYFVLNDAYAISKEHCKKIMYNQIEKESKIYIKLTEKLAESLDELALIEMAQSILIKKGKRVFQFKYCYNEQLKIFKFVLLE